MLPPNEFELTFRVQNYGAKFQKNQVRTATTGEDADTDRETDRQTERQTERRE